MVNLRPAESSTVEVRGRNSGIKAGGVPGTSNIDNFLGSQAAGSFIPSYKRALGGSESETVDNTSTPTRSLTEHEHTSNPTDSRDRGNTKTAEELLTERRSDYTCYHCGGSFPTNRALRKHLSDIKGARTEHLEIKSALHNGNSARLTLSGRGTGATKVAVQPVDAKLPAPSQVPRAEASPDINMKLQMQVRQLFEQVRQLQEQLSARPPVTHSGASPPWDSISNQRPSHAMPETEPSARIANTTELMSRITLDPGKDSPRSSRKSEIGTPYELRFRKPLFPDQVLNEARESMKKAFRTIKWLKYNVDMMSSPDLSPLMRSLDVALPLFERHLKDVFADAGKRTPRVRIKPTARQGLGIRKLKIQRTVEAPREHMAAPLELSIQNIATDLREQARTVKIFESPGADTQRLIRSLHTKANGTKPSVATIPQQETELNSEALHIDNSSEPSLEELNEQSLLTELFPEASSYIQPHYTPRNPYPKLDLPKDVPLIRPQHTTTAKTQRQRILDTFKTRTEPITVLQLLHCSTELSESDFRRLIPKGKHIESWIRDGEFQQVIPGRDPLSLERLPFYYLLFKSPESALAYQNNAARLHKLSGLHQPSSIFSAIPPPKGFLEDGEDLNAVLSSYLLKPTSLQLNLNMVMQPYNPSLRALIDAGGYKPIVPHVDEKGTKVWKVLMHIEGWEPSREDLYYTLVRHAYDRGLTWPFYNNSSHAIVKLRDLIDVKSKLQPISSANPRAANPSAHTLPDPTFEFLNLDPLEQNNTGAMSGKGGVSQIVMNRLYNRWIIEFEEEHAARRFARMWHRRVLPSPKIASWKDTEEVRMVNAEFLW